jgi:hypothetical protein
MRTVSWAVVLLSIAASASEGALGQQLQDQQPPGQQPQAQQQVPEAVAFRASATATYSDNPARTTTGESATALDGLVGLRIAQQSAALFVDADLSVIQREYVEGHDLPAQTIPNGYLNLLAGPPGSWFNWSVTDNFGQISSEPFEALIAPDRQNVNILSTGPNFKIPFDSQDHLDLAARYGLDTFGDSSLDDQNYKGQAELVHDIGSVSQLGLAYTYQRVDFRDVSLSSADLTQGYAQYVLAGARSYVVLEGGVDQLEQAPAPRTSAGHVLVLLRRHLSEAFAFEAAYRHGITDAASAFVSASRDVFAQNIDQNVEGRALPFVGAEGYAQLTRSTGRLLAAVEVTASQESFPTDTVSNRRVRGANLSSDYRLSSKLSFNVRAGYYDENYPVAQQTGHWYEGTIGLTRHLSPSLTVTLQGMRARGSGNALPNAFTEDRAMLQLVYAPGAERLLHVYDTNAPFRFYDRPVQPPLAH